MMEIKVTVLLPGMPEAINRLADAISGTQAASIPAQNKAKLIEEKPVPNNSTPVPNNPPAVPNNSAPVPNNVTAFPTQNVAPIPSAVSAMASPAAVPAAVTAPVQMPAGREYNLDELAKAAAVLMDNGKMVELAALVQKYGVPSLMQLNKAHFAAFAEDLKALGAVL